jgi:hypothetical protein
MRWRAAGLWALSLGLLGCPEEHGKDGAIDQAVLQDMKAAVQPRQQEKCPPPELLKALCADPKSEKCPKGCK